MPSNPTPTYPADAHVLAQVRGNTTLALRTEAQMARQWLTRTPACHTTIKDATLSRLQRQHFLPVLCKPS